MAPHEILPHLAENFLAVAEQVFKGRQPETLRLVKDLLEGFVADPKENGKAEPSTPKFFANEDSNSSNPSKSTRLTKSGEPKADLKAAFLAKFKLLIKVWNKEGPLLTATPAADATLTNRIASLSNSLALTQLKCCKYLYLKLAESVKANLSNSMYLPLSDILYFIAMTLNNFTSELYSNFEVSVKIRECDLINPRKAFERNQLPYEEQIKHLEKPIEVVKK